MKIRSFLRAIDPEVYVRLEHVDGTEIAFNRAESLIKHGDPRFSVLGAYPDDFRTRCGQLGVNVLVDDEEVKE